MCVTPLRRPSRPVRSAALDGEQVEAAAWKSTNLRRKESEHSPPITVSGEKVQRSPSCGTGKENEAQRGSAMNSRSHS